MNTRLRITGTPQLITYQSGRTSNLSTLTDVNTTNLLNSSLLQYDSQSQTWIATNVLNADGFKIDCGDF